ncbi:MAG: T9SS type A sorting domain-containing protein [Tannerella sp.]|nr:T9SS type A sorting domain-containing protein [Tannerella sp.]
MFATHDGTARIYNLTGQLIKALPHAAGETVQTTLPRGVYIVVVNGKAYKIEN